MSCTIAAILSISPRRCLERRPWPRIRLSCGLFARDDTLMSGCCCFTGPDQPNGRYMGRPRPPKPVDTMFRNIISAEISPFLCARSVSRRNCESVRAATAANFVKHIISEMVHFDARMGFVRRDCAVRIQGAITPAVGN